MSLCTHLTLTLRLISNALCCIRLWWMEVWLQPESTKTWYVPPLILTGIWYCPAWSGAAPGESGTRTSNPTSIMGQWSWKCPGSPHLQQAGPGLTAAPAAEEWARDCRREDDGDAVGSGPPPRRGRRSPWPLPLLCGARGAAGTWDRARERGEGRRRERERERLVRGSPTPGHATIWSSASWMACVSDVGRWHWTHSAVRRGSRAMNCSSTTRLIYFTPSTSRDLAMSHLRQASRSCWAITNGRPLSHSSTERKRCRCYSGFRPTRWRMARLRSS